MEANAIVLSPEQFVQLKESIKKDLMSDLVKNTPTYTRGIYSAEWVGIRDDIQARLQGDLGTGCGHWYQNQQGLYSAFRLAFQKDRVPEFRSIDQKKLGEFYNELMQLIYKYRGLEMK